MTDPRTVWEQYVSSWKAEGRKAKRGLIEGAIAPKGTYTDPIADPIDSVEGLVDYMVAFHQQVPGGHFVTEWYQFHHGASAARWTMRDRDGNVIGDGVSHARYDENGQIEAVTGFFDGPEAG